MDGTPTWPPPDAYPANAISPANVDRAEATFAAIANQDAKKGWSGGGQGWDLVGPQVNAVEPGVLAFSGATNNTASRTTALVVYPDCGTRRRTAVPRLGRCLGRWRLADGQRLAAEPELDADEARSSSTRTPSAS